MSPCDDRRTTHDPRVPYPFVENGAEGSTKRPEYVTAAAEKRAERDPWVSRRYENKTLNERNPTHGNFTDNAALSQALKESIALHTRAILSAVQQEAIDMIVLKLSRIATGNPNEPDHWRDIAGYADLARAELK
jgi:hypothetical protein